MRGLPCGVPEVAQDPRVGGRSRPLDPRPHRARYWRQRARVPSWAAVLARRPASARSHAARRPGPAIAVRRRRRGTGSPPRGRGGRRPRAPASSSPLARERVEARRRRPRGGRRPHAARTTVRATRRQQRPPPTAARSMKNTCRPLSRGRGEQQRRARARRRAPRGPPPGNRPRASRARLSWQTVRTSALSTPIPNAFVATTTGHLPGHEAPLRLGPRRRAAAPRGRRRWTARRPARARAAPASRSHSARVPGVDDRRQRVRRAERRRDPAPDQPPSFAHADDREREVRPVEPRRHPYRHRADPAAGPRCPSRDLAASPSPWRRGSPARRASAPRRRGGSTRAGSRAPVETQCASSTTNRPMSAWRMRSRKPGEAKRSGAT